MASYQEAKSKLTNIQLSKFKSAAKNKTGKIWRLNQKKFEDEEFPHKLFLAKRKTTKIRNALANNMSTDIKLSQDQISKIIQSGRYFGFWLGNLGRKAITKSAAVPLARDSSPRLVSNLASNTINKFEIKIYGKGAVRAGKNMNDVIKIIK